MHGSCPGLKSLVYLTRSCESTTGSFKPEGLAEQLTCSPMTHWPALIFSSSKCRACLSEYFTPMSHFVSMPLVFAWRRETEKRLVHLIEQCFSNFLGSCTPFSKSLNPSTPFNHLNPLSGVPQGSILVIFAENSRLTSLQRVALRRVVSLSSCYFLQKPFPQKEYFG